ncbi:hypothetical protein [Flavobacterium davisii]|uniref:Uncharacterized protein n=1 Tax=Flavobacterium davisii TaxID=2906077 RepID=A0A246GLE0_9FLAO|nr:hypothetical protein [Flavobacterium davisii]OWP85123.1 hypothetical protein BWK59_01760 [Flavobacterium davisii]QYS89353.1 hypothetical protein JJC05_03100 [Flavobacterium davisii]
MEAIRQFVKVKNHQIKITLPDNFLTDEVEVIILAKENDFYLTNEMKETPENRLNEPESEYISSKESLDSIKAKYGF